jgi:hypothetical protein
MPCGLSARSEPSTVEQAQAKTVPGRLLGRAGPTTVVQKQGKSVPGRLPAKSGPSTVEQDGGIPLDRFNLDRLCALPLTETMNTSAMNTSSSVQERADNAIQECKSAESEFANHKQLMQRLREEVGGSYPVEIRLDRLFQLVDLQKNNQVREVQPYIKLRNLLISQVKCCGSAMVLMWIRIPIQGFDDQKC